MAGVTREGFELKRLRQVISDLENEARNQYGDSIYTDANSLLGRALRVNAPSLSDLWEVSEEVYNSFDPNKATGVSLDRIVAYGGLTRLRAVPSRVQLLVGGDYNTTIDTGSYVDSPATSNRFLTSESVTLDEDRCSGTTLQVVTASSGEDYIITLGVSSFTYTAQASDDIESIATAIANEINTTTSNFSASVVDGEPERVKIEFEDVFVRRDIIITGNLAFQKVKKLVSAESEDIGSIEQPSSTLTQIATPIVGWDSVTNPIAASLGRLRETDTELRLRFEQSKELNARGTLDALFSALLEIPDVSRVQVYENVQNATDSIGLPPKCFSAVVLGGSSQQIAETIWDTKPAGILAFGNTTLEITDTQGLPHDISFSRPQSLNVYITVTISEEEDTGYQENIDELIIDSLITYFENNYSVGDNVIYSRLYTPINNAGSGYQVDSLEIGTTENPTGTSNITVAFDEIAQLLRGNIEVVYA